MIKKLHGLKPLIFQSNKTSNGEYHRYNFAALLAISSALFLTACLPYLYVLKLSLTGIDTIPTIAAARIDSISQIPDVFSRELRGGVAETPISYYRPLTLVTYSIDYLIWGWDPKGYHATDLFLHGCAAIAVLFLVLIAFERTLSESTLISLLFVFHPATIEVVPAISRRQEPLLMIGIAIALIGVHEFPRARAWVVALLGTLICIASVERGLVIPGIIFAYILLIKNGLTFNENALIKDVFISAVKYTLPFGLLAVAFYVFRSVRFQDSGITFLLSNLYTTPIFFLVAVFYPEQFIPLRWPSSHLLQVFDVLIGYILIMVILVVFWNSKQKRNYLFLGMWMFLFIGVISIAGQNLSWYTYTMVVPASMLLVSLFQEGVNQVRQSNSGRLLGSLKIILSTIPILLFVTASPIFQKYPGWQVSSQQTQTILSDTLEIIHGTPIDMGLVFINIPSHYRETNSDYLITRSAAILWPYSLQTWFAANNVKNEVVILGSSAHSGVIRSPEMELVNSNTLKIFFTSPDSGYSETEFEWPPQEFRNKSFRVYVYDGTRFIESQWLEINNQSLPQP